MDLSPSTSSPWPLKREERSPPVDGPTAPAPIRQAAPNELDDNKVQSARAPVAPAADARAALDGPPPLSPAAQHALRHIDEDTVQHFQWLVIESQDAIKRGTRNTDATERANLTRSERLLAGLGPISEMQSDKLMSAFVLLSANGTRNLRDTLAHLQTVQDEQSEASLVRTRRLRQEGAEQTRRLLRTEAWLSPVVVTAKAATAVLTVALMSTAAPYGIALAALGGALGAGGALALKRQNPREDWRRAATIAADGALLGASLTGALGAPLLAIARGTSPFMALGAGNAYAAERLALRQWAQTANLARLAFGFTAAGGQAVLDRGALNVRNNAALQRVEMVMAELFQQGRQASLDGITRIVNRRHQSLNQAQQLLSKRHQVTVRIQAQMRH